MLIACRIAAAVGITDGEGWGYRSDWLIGLRIISELFPITLPLPIISLEVTPHFPVILFLLQYSLRNLTPCLHCNLK